MSKWETLNVRPGTVAQAEKLAEKLTKEKGVKVPRPDAVAIAIQEALDRRKAGKKS